LNFLIEGIVTLFGPRFLKESSMMLSLRSLCALLLLTLLFPPNGMNGDRNLQGASPPNLLSLDTFDTSPEFVSAFERSREIFEKFASDDPLCSFETLPAAEQVVSRPHCRPPASIQDTAISILQPTLPRPPPFAN
jgi:hypothetical protein